MVPGRSTSSGSARSDPVPGSPVTIGSGLSPTEAIVFTSDVLLDRDAPVCEHPATINDHAQEAKNRMRSCASRVFLLLIKTAR